MRLEEALVVRLIYFYEDLDDAPEMNSVKHNIDDLHIT